MARRRLTEAERALWDHVVRGADPLAGRPARPPSPNLPVPAPSPLPAQPSPLPAQPAPLPLPAFRLGEKVDHHRTDDLIPGLAQAMGQAPVRMDARTHQRMSRGKIAPEARIDLHGMTQAEAHPALVDFIIAAAARGLRLVLVITGKGKLRDDLPPMPVRDGVLRHQVPRWLSMAPLAPLVLQVTQAHASHGGGGALYVYLRRRR